MTKSIYSDSSESLLRSASLATLISAVALGLPVHVLAQEAQVIMEDDSGPATEAATVTLDEVTVIPNWTATPEREVGSAVTVITGEELEKQQIRIVSDVLRQSPGDQPGGDTARLCGGRGRDNIRNAEQGARPLVACNCPLSAKVR